MASGGYIPSVVFMKQAKMIIIKNETKIKNKVPKPKQFEHTTMKPTKKIVFYSSHTSICVKSKSFGIKQKKNKIILKLK